jgi:hypothetical protein
MRLSYGEPNIELSSPADRSHALPDLRTLLLLRRCTLGDYSNDLLGSFFHGVYAFVVLPSVMSLK